VKGCAAEGDHAAGIVERGGLRGDQHPDLVEVIGGLVGVAGGEAGLAANPSEAEAAAVQGDGVGDGVARLGVLADGDEGLGEQGVPVFTAGVVVEGGADELDGLLVFAGPDEFAGVVRCGVGSGGGGWEEEQESRGQQAEERGEMPEDAGGAGLGLRVDATQIRRR